jgi:DNA-binding transcriptional regulator LsrR (DeoR family)
MFAIYFIQAVTSRKKDLIDELDGIMILKFGEGLTQRSVNALCSMSEESIEDIISQAKRHDVVGLIIEED